MNRGSVNKVIIVGHVGEDPEIRYTPSGTAVTNLSVATNETIKDSKGSTKELTEWHRIVLWAGQAEFASNYVKKGQLVYIEGRLQTRNWQDRNKVDRWTTEIVGNITLLGPAKGGESSAAQAKTPPAEQPPDEDDIPF
jgi:single-strand DNA-binding protein